MPYKVKVDRSLCIGAASCVALAPNSFELDKEGKSTVKKKDGSFSSEFVNFSDLTDDEATIIDAAKACPVNAILVVKVDEKGNEIGQL